MVLSGFGIYALLSVAVEDFVSEAHSWTALRICDLEKKKKIVLYQTNFINTGRSISSKMIFLKIKQT